MEFRVNGAGSDRMFLSLMDAFEYAQRLIAGGSAARLYVGPRSTKPRWVEVPGAFNATYMQAVEAIVAAFKDLSDSTVSDTVEE